MQTSLTEQIASSQSQDARTRILLLEDDPDFCGVLRELLDPIRYEVTQVDNGVEGLKKIASADFDIVLCDMMMPTLPGDMFYLAVERTKPYLCKRFIFMTGHRGDPKWDAFVRKVGGLMLWKPIQVRDLLDGIESVLKKAQAGVRR
jgi:CheY-like chemotaxis protein